MRSNIVKIGLSTAVLLLAFAGLLRSTLQDGAEYYKHVDEVLSEPARWQGKRLQLHGFIVKGSITRRPDSLDYRFKVESKGAVVNARYSGIVPDTFKDEAEVVMKGVLTDEGFDVAPNGVMAKCPSKYEPRKAIGGAAPGV